MTQEEAKTYLENYRKMYADLAPERFLEAIDCILSKPSLPSNLDEAAEKLYPYKEGYDAELPYPSTFDENKYERDAFKAGYAFAVGQGWIDDGSMPPETKQTSDTLQGHREWTESVPVLVWDSMYGAAIDWTRNGKWHSEDRGGYRGQVVHGIVAWRPIPEYNKK